MSKSITRRDILKFTGGGILGMMFSPLPWKLLDDSAIWTQNWSLTPPLPHGPITTAFSHCTLCGGGCAVQANCVNGMPYFLSGVQANPISQGILCTRGIAGHHSAYHPLRIVHPHTFTGSSDNSAMRAISLREALDTVARKIHTAEGSVAILDQQPGRTISGFFQQFLAPLPKGLYLTPPSREDATIVALRSMMAHSSGSYGYDFERANLIVSFGAPLLDGWDTPGRMTAVRNAGKSTIIQIDSRYSRTARQADQWISLRPGTERFLALSLAYVLVHENLITGNIISSITDFDDYKNILASYSPENTVRITGIEPAVITSLAHKLASSNAAIVLSGADPGGGPFDRETEKAIASLNILIGSAGRSGGIVSRNTVPGETNDSLPVSWSKIPDHSISVLIVDGADSGYAIPWRLIEKKLVPDNRCVVSLSPVLTEISSHADFLIPAPAYLESLNDVPATATGTVATFSLSKPLLPKQDGTTEPADVIRQLASSLLLSPELPPYEEMMKQKAEAIYRQRRGTLHLYAEGTTVSVKDLTSGDEIWTKLNEGALWCDEPAKQPKLTTFTVGMDPAAPNGNSSEGLPMIANGWRGATSAAQISPLLSKVFQESELRDGNGVVSVNPATARKLGVTKDEPAQLSTNNGSLKVRVKIDSTVRPGTIEVSIGPLPNGVETPMHPAGNTILNLCEVTNDGTWRITTANLQKA